MPRTPRKWRTPPRAPGSSWLTRSTPASTSAINTPWPTTITSTNRRTRGTWAQPRENIDYVNFVADLPIPGHPGRLATPGAINGDTGDTNIGSRRRLPPERIPLRTGEAAHRGPRGLPLHALADPVTFGGEDGDETTTVIPDANVSLTYDITPKITTYATFDYSQYTHVGVGGGLTPGSGSKYSANDFHNESFLEEGGVKASLLKDTLFVNFGRFSPDARFLRCGWGDCAHRREGHRVRGQLAAEQELLHDGGLHADRGFPLQRKPGFRFAARAD